MECLISGIVLIELYFAYHLIIYIAHCIERRKLEHPALYFGFVPYLIFALNCTALLLYIVYLLGGFIKQIGWI